MHEMMFELDQRKEILNTNTNPYSAIGLVEACYDNEKHYSVASLIEPNKVITCITNLINTETNQITSNLIFAFVKDCDFRKVKVKKVSIMKNVKISENPIKHQQKMAIIQLEENVVSQAKCLPIFWNNQITTHTQVSLVAYTFFDLDNNNGFEMAEENIKILNKKQNLLQYKAYTDKRYSGAPLLMKRQGKYQIVGLHSEVNKTTNHHEGIVFDDEIKARFQ